MLLRQPTPPFGTGYGQQTFIMIYTLLFHPLSRILRIVGCNSTYLGMKAADDANKYEYLDFRGETFENVREVLYKLLKKHSVRQFYLDFSHGVVRKQEFLDFVANFHDFDCRPSFLDISFTGNAFSDQIVNIAVISESNTEYKILQGIVKKQSLYCDIKDYLCPLYKETFDKACIERDDATLSYLGDMYSSGYVVRRDVDLAKSIFKSLRLKRSSCELKYKQMKNGIRF
jgi:hypothetical protein